MDRFLLAENLNIRDNDRPTYILQTKKTKMLIEIVPLGCTANMKTADVKKTDILSLFTYINSDGVSEFFAFKVKTFYQENVDVFSVNNELKDAWGWYEKYLIEEDALIDDKNKGVSPSMN